MNIRQLLFNTQHEAFHILFGDSSEAGVFKASNVFSIGVSICGRDLLKEKQMLNLFESSGCILMERTTKLKIQGKSRRVFLFHCHSNSQIIKIIGVMKNWKNGRSRFLIRPTQPVMIWKSYPVRAVYKSNRR